MISLADAGGRIMYSYKELSELAGYTHRVHELLTVLENVAEDIYVRENLPVSMEELNSPSRPQNYDLNDVRGVLRKTYDGVRMKNVPIVTPPGEVLISNLSMDIRPGMHVLISGSNGCGKTSILRIISGLWPVFRGTVYRPADENIIFIPQRSYLSIGTLRNQIIYPDTKEQMTARGLTDADLMEILKSVHLEYLPDREGGFDTRKEWKDVFSGGEKQRVTLHYNSHEITLVDESCTTFLLQA